MSIKKVYALLLIVAGFLCLQPLIFLALHVALDYPLGIGLAASTGAACAILLLFWVPLFRRLVIHGDKRDLDRLNAELEQVTKKLQKQIHDLHNLFEVSIHLTSILEPQQLIKSSMLSLIGQLQTNQTIVFLPSKDAPDTIYPIYAKGFSKQFLDDFSMSLHDPVFIHFGEQMIALDLLNTDLEIASEQCRKLIDQGITLIAPIISKNRIRGLIAIGEKMNREMFSRSEQELFSLLTHFISVAFSNSILYQKMEQISITDELTGLYNYRYFKRRLEDEILRARRYKHNLSLVLFDVDHFKNYNDTLGHPAGDEALKTVSIILQSSIRQSDIAVRYGGEEFCVIVPEAEMNRAQEFAERLRLKIETHRFHREEVQPGGKLTVSLGVSCFPAHADSAQELIEKADIVLYKAKAMGRNRTCLFSEEDD
jgi:diguanylate cyclase (GGDEF)-like protein